MKPSSPAPPDTQARFSTVMGGIWLIFLVFPLMNVVRLGWGWRMVAGLGLLVVFAAFNLMGYWAAGRYQIPPERPYPAGVAVVAGSLLVAAGAGLVVGPTMVGLLIFVVALSSYALPRVWAYPTVIGCVAATVAVPLLAGRLTQLVAMPVITAVVALANMLIVGFVSRLTAADEARYQLNLLQERERVARDVHDVLGHTLTVLALKAQVAERMVAADPDRARAELRQILDLSRQGMSEVRRTVTGLRGEDLAVQLRNAQRLLADAQVSLELIGQAEAVPPPRRALAAAVVREAVTNVIRHCAADHCRIEIGPDGLQVSDDGQGQVNPHAGHGITGLRERAAAEGATMTAEADKTGVTLAVSW